MNAKERLLKTMAFEEPDHVGWFENSVDSPYVTKDFGVKPSTLNLKGFMNTLRFLPGWRWLASKLINSPAIIEKGYEVFIKTFRKIGIEYLPLAITMLLTKSKFLDPLHYVDEFGRIFQIDKDPHTGVGVTNYAGGYLQSFEDYEQWGSIDPVHPLRVALSKIILKLQEKYDGIFMFPSFAALLEPTWESFGMPVFSRLLRKDDGEFIQKVFEDRGKACMDLVAMLLDDGHEVVLMYDDMGYKDGLFMSPKHFQRLVFPWYKRIVDRVHGRGAKIILHSCGDITPLFGELVGIGFDAINPIEPTAGMDIFKIHEHFGEKITLIGNLSTQDLLSSTPDFIRSSTLKLIKELAPGGGYVFASSHSIQPPVTAENFRAMHEALKRYGVYPINIGN